MAAYNYQFLSSSHLCSVQAHQSWLEVDLQISPFPATAVYSHFVPFHPLLLSLQWLTATWRESPKIKLTFERVDVSSLIQIVISTVSFTGSWDLFNFCPLPGLLGAY